MDRPPLTYLITKGESTPDNFEEKRNEVLEIIKAAVLAGISMIQLREKRLEAKQLFELARDGVAAVSGSSTKLLINGRTDIASAAAADGVHLPEDGMRVADVRQSYPKPFLIGASVHNVDAAREAKEGGADFVLFGPVFDSIGKQGKGVEMLSKVCLAIGECPVLAVGGIDETNYHLVLDAGAAGYAAIRYLNEYVRTI